jgi:hypothetical protein
MWRNGIKYFPVITCINPELLEGIPVVKGDFLFSPGLDLPSSDDSNSSDVIFAWQGSIWDNYFKIITLNESQVVDIREPIFVLSLATKNEIELDKKLSSMASPFAVKSNEFLHTENTSLLSTGYYITSLRVNFPYEGSGKSEVRAVQLASDAINSFFTDTDNWEPGGYTNGGLYSMSGGDLVKEIRSTEINSTINLPSSQHLYLSGDHRGSSDRVIFNLFEYDWYASKKLLGALEASYIPTFSCNMLGRMTYADEWYTFVPTCNNDLLPDCDSQSPINLNFIYTNGSKTYSNAKGFVTVQRKY